MIHFSMAEKPIFYPILLSYVKGNLSISEFPLGAKEFWLREWDDASKIKLFFLPQCIYSQVFCSTVFDEVSYVDSRDLPELFLFTGSCLLVFCGGKGEWRMRSPTLLSC